MVDSTCNFYGEPSVLNMGTSQYGGSVKTKYIYMNIYKWPRALRCWHWSLRMDRWIDGSMDVCMSVCMYVCMYVYYYVHHIFTYILNSKLITMYADDTLLIKSDTSLFESQWQCQKGLDGIIKWCNKTN